MKFTKLTPWLAVLPFILLFSYCTEEQRMYSRSAEKAYVDVLFAMHQGDEAGTREAARDLDLSIGELRQRWFRPLGEENMDEVLYRLEKAEMAYGDARESIENGNLPLAAIQLDRATYELEAADPTAFNTLYIGSIYDFVGGWLEVDYVVMDNELCSLKWEDFTPYGRDAQKLWRQVKHNRPSDIIYGNDASAIDQKAFSNAHNAMELRLEEFVEILKTQDQCQAQAAAFEVTEAMWDLVKLFGTKPRVNF